MDRQEHRRGRRTRRRAGRAPGGARGGAAVERRHDGAAILRLAGREPVRAAAGRSVALLPAAAARRRPWHWRWRRCVPESTYPRRRWWLSAGWRRPRAAGAGASSGLRRAARATRAGPPARVRGARRARRRRRVLDRRVRRRPGVPASDAVSRTFGSGVVYPLDMFAHLVRETPLLVTATLAGLLARLGRPGWRLAGAAASPARAVDWLGAVVRRDRVGHHRPLPAAAGHLHAVRAGRGRERRRRRHAAGGAAGGGRPRGARRGRRHARELGRGAHPDRACRSGPADAGRRFPARRAAVRRPGRRRRRTGHAGHRWSNRRLARRSTSSSASASS